MQRIPKRNIIKKQVTRIVIVLVISLLTSEGPVAFSAGNNDITDLAPLNGLTRLHFLFLENNKVANLSSLVEMAGADFKGPKNFAPFLRLYIKGNPESVIA